MDQPTAEEALKKLEPLIGEWRLEAIPPGGEPWPGEARATFEWHDSHAHVIQRSTVLARLSVMEGRTLAIAAYRTRLDDNFQIMAEAPAERAKIEADP